MVKIIQLVAVMLLAMPTLAAINDDDLNAIKVKHNLKVTILEDNKKVNAYALNGKIYITRSMLNEPWVSSKHIEVILLHETGHIVNDHQTMKANVIKLLSYIDSRIDVLDNQSISKSLFVKVGLDFFFFISRIFELEADNYAIDVVKKQGYTKDICDVFLMDKTEPQFIEETTHPSNKNRKLNCEKRFK